MKKLKNVPALKLTKEEQWAVLGGDTQLLRDKVRWFLEQSASDNLILALPGKKNPLESMGEPNNNLWFTKMTAMFQ